ncbi:MAG: hypothetical protein VYC12_03535, partial [Candidatus Thermoplasmatota archaeon]|nr:hypothetical protein [Candidatus Thermoplasmatota archaeon]
VFDAFGKVGSFFTNTWKRFTGTGEEQDSPETRAMKDVIAADDAQQAQIEAGNKTVLNHKELKSTIFAALVEFDYWKNNALEGLADDMYEKRMYAEHSIDDE